MIAIWRKNYSLLRKLHLRTLNLCKLPVESFAISCFFAARFARMSWLGRLITWLPEFCWRSEAATAKGITVGQLCVWLFKLPELGANTRNFNALEAFRQWVVTI